MSYNPQDNAQIWEHESSLTSVYSSPVPTKRVWKKLQGSWQLLAMWGNGLEPCEEKGKMLRANHLGFITLALKNN